ncbi:hypothetical protein BKI52_38875 [marine bacterium AO1-C]|nr:hypothetical protein BKI52_38875 [marine bacterium AO1-C]
MKKVERNFSWLYYGLIVVIIFLPYVSSALALAVGIGLALFKLKTCSIHRYTSKILKASIVLLGFGMSLREVITTSKNGFIETVVCVSLIMLGGILLGKLFKVEKNITVLITAGTAICGGSAIAAVSPILKSKDYQTSFALVVVFVLNAAALFLFPFIGHQLALSQEAFGYWAAIAIHDTSSVVGASAAYGDKALQIATTVKLIRALWIIPLTIMIALFNKNKDRNSIKFPWFILLFIGAIVFSNLLPAGQIGYEYLRWLGKRGMVVALFLIGSNISIEKIKQSGFKSFALGILLWAITASVSLFALTR